MSNGRFRREPPDGGDSKGADGAEEEQYPLSAYDGLDRWAHEHRLRLESSIAVERGAAPSRVRQLLAHPPARRPLVLAARPRYRSYCVAEHLLTLCRESWSDDPTSAEDLVHLALTVIDALEATDPSEIDSTLDAINLPPPTVLHDLRARAWSYVANCRRIRSDLRAVPEAFATARDHLAQGDSDPEDEVAVLDLEASYFIDQRRFDDAERALETVVGLYREAEERHQEGRAMIKLGRLRQEQGRPADAVPLARRAIELVDLQREPPLELVIWKNLAQWLAEAGRLNEAEAILPKVRRIARAGASRLEWLRFLWAEGVIYHHLGRYALAAEAIEQARTGLMDEGIGYDAALATLDLALVHLDAGAPRIACDLAGRLVPILSMGDLRGEAIAALALVRRAMEQRTLTRWTVEEAVARLRRSRRDRIAPIEGVE